MEVHGLRFTDRTVGRKPWSVDRLTEWVQRPLWVPQRPYRPVSALILYEVDQILHGGVVQEVHQGLGVVEEHIEGRADLLVPAIS